MSVVLIHRKAKLAAKTIKALEKAGHVPVVVDSFDDVRVLAPETEGLVVEMAAEVIRQDRYGNPREHFGQLLANRLLPKSR